VSNIAISPKSNQVIHTGWVIKDRAAAKLRPWADVFPYVNGGLFSGSLDVPRFSRIADA